jgi:hypothetical protein
VGVEVEVRLLSRERVIGGLVQRMAGRLPAMQETRHALQSPGLDLLVESKALLEECTE